ncbi:MAG: hypothetical protein NT030_08335 [Candidatus Saganbacteria bacterium]|nr:hypothetical protein [Candidatus Saganbacteria bacterium]
MPEGIQQVQGSQKLALGFSVQDTGIEYPAEFQALSKWINDFCLLTRFNGALL